MNDTLRSDWLDAFACFAQHLNFTRAAKELHISQPALHVQIAKLAEELGMPLYLRRGRGLELTPAGTRVLAFARETRERSTGFVADLRGEAGEARVALCAGEGAYLYLLGDAIRSFSRQSLTDLRLLTRDRAGTVDAVRSDEAQLGVASLDAPPDGLVLDPLCDIEQVVVAPRSHRIAKKRTAVLQDLEGASLIVPPAGSPHRAMIARALRAAGVSWRVAVEATGWELIVHFAALGLGLAVVNGFCRIPKGLIARPLRGLPPVHYSMLSRKGAHRSAHVERLRQLLVTRVQVRPG